MDKKTLYKIWSFIDPHMIEHKSIRDGIKQNKHLLDGLVLDAGCGGMPYKDIIIGTYIGVDITGGNIKADLHKLPIKPGKFDALMSTQTLEHLHDPLIAIKEFNRALKKGGYAVIVAPFFWGVHDAPHDYYRYTHFGLKHLLESNGFEVISIKNRGGPAALMAQLTNRFLFKIFTKLGKTRFVIGIPLIIIWNIVTYIGMFLDIFLNKHMYDTLGYVCVAKKI